MPASAMNVLIAFIVMGLLLIGFGVPMAFKRVRPNRYYGFRVGRALDEERVWYEANVASGRWLAMAGGAVIVSAAINAALGTRPGVALLVNGVVMSLGIIASVGAGFSAMNRDEFPPDDA